MNRHPLGHLKEEIRDFIDRETEDNIARGMSPEDAYMAARRKFGNATQVQENARRIWVPIWIEQMGQDVQYALRTFRRNAGFVAIISMTLALGIGANTAIFSAVDEALFRPLPVPDPNRVVGIYNLVAHDGRYLSSSFPDYEVFRDRSRTLDSLSAYVRFPMAVTAGTRVERAQIEAATGDYFEDTLCLQPVFGRNFEKTDDKPGAVPVAMLHEEYWTRAFARDPEVIGQTIRLEQQPFRIVGIVPARFHGSMLHWQDPPEVWIPLQTSPLVLPAFGPLMHQRGAWLVLVGRLRDGYEISQAQAELETLSDEAAKGLSARVFPAASSKFWPTYRDGVAHSLAMFGIAAGLVLLLACLNIANLLLERGQARRREFAIRASLGTSRGRLLRQLLTENALLAVPGFLLAILVARGMQKILIGAPTAFGLRLNLDLAIDGRTLAIGAALSVMAILVFGVGPAWWGARAEMIRESSGSSVRSWTRYVLVGIQITLSTVLLVGGGLFGKSLLHSYAAPLGFRSDHLLTVSLTRPQNPAAIAQARESYADMLRLLRRQPDVEAAALAQFNLLSLTNTAMVTSGSVSPIQASTELVSAGYFAAAGIRIVSGRGFEDPDLNLQEPVAVVNQTLVARLWPGERNAVGKQLQMSRGPMLRIIGVAEDTKYRSPWEDAPPFIYGLSAASSTPAAADSLLIRTRSAPEALIPVIQRTWSEVGNGQPLYNFRTGAEIVNLALEPERLASMMFGMFGLLAVALASAGLYGVMTFSVRQRIREFGIRLAIGAQPAELLVQVLGSSLAVAMAGIAVGAAAGIFLMKLIASRLHGIASNDATTFTTVGLLLALVSLVASLGPALRASRIDPVTALRQE